MAYAPDAAAQRLRHLSAITEAALTHLDLDELLDALLERLREILDSDTAAVLLIDGDTEELVPRAAKGLEEAVTAGIRLPVGRGFAGRIAAERRPLFLPELESADILNPILRQRGLASILGVPLIVAGDVIGVLHVGTLERRDFTDDDTELLQLAGDRMAVAIDHARLYAAEREARMIAERQAEQLSQLHTITDAALGRMPLGDEVLVAMLERVRDVLHVETTAILLLSPEGDELVARAARGLEEEIPRGVRIPVGKGFAGRIAAERRPVVLDTVDHTQVLNPLLAEKGICSLLGVPLVVEDRVLGVVHVGTLTPRSFSEADVALLERAADRIALTVERGHQHGVAEVLQRSLLPEEPPELPGLAMAADYVPGADDAHVGGDWYDVVPLPRGKVGIAMGDVVSRGIRAAASMGQMRTALRAYALDGDSPGPVLDRLDRLVRGFGQREMATVAYVLLDPSTGAAAYSLAGHPPPLVISADGSTRWLDAVTSRPIGVAAVRRYEEAAVQLEPGDTLLLYTDGLVERRGTSLDEGLDELERLASAHALHPQELTATLLEWAGPATDDIALLAVRVPLGEAEPLRLRLRAEPGALAPMRRALREWLAAAGASEQESYDILVALGEACTNAIEHAYGPAQAEFDVEADLVDGTVEVTVRDTGTWRAARGSHRGRGLGLIEQLMDELEVTTDESGTSVRMRRAVGTEGRP
jgi:GAF domain-containing protein/anti-sigma regulatory factor (Ser/Thr protein kinase)